MNAQTADTRSTRVAAQAPAAPKAAKAPKEVPQLKRSEFHLAEAKRNHWFGIAADGTKPDAYETHPYFWMLLSDSVRAYDLVELVARDGKTWAEYLVVDVEPGYVRVQLLRSVELPERKHSAEARIPAGFLIRAGGPDEEAWVVVREDGWILNRNQFHRTYEEARTWLLNAPGFRAEPGTQYLP